MPGFTGECMSGAHEACGNTDCRCQCHPWVKALAQKAEVQRAAPPPPQLQNTCPTCGARAAATDRFCRLDGSLMRLGKQCMGCGAPGQNDDKFCWQCGLGHGTKPPETAAEEAPKEDALIRIRREAEKLGLLRETTV
jgi:hypothetical protein